MCRRRACFPRRGRVWDWYSVIEGGSTDTGWKPTRIKLCWNHNKYSLAILVSYMRYDLFRNARDLFRPRGTVGFPKFRFEGILPKMIFYSFVKSIIIILCNAGPLLGAHHIVQTVHVWVGDTPPHITQVTLSPSINLVYKCMHNLQFVYMCDFQKLMNYVFTSCVQSRHTKCTPTYD